MTTDRRALGEFLRARRSQVTPQQAGMEPFPGRRQVPGLRREELAVLAGLSPDYYRRVEQGRQANVSKGALDAIAKALSLDEVERVHLHRLADPPADRSDAVSADARPDPRLLRLMDVLGDVPTMIMGRGGEVLARTELLVEILGAPLEVGSSYFRYVLCDPVARVRITDWSDCAGAMLALMRAEVASHPGDRRLINLVSELQDVDPSWERHDVRDYDKPRAKTIDHPVVGRLSFALDAVMSPGEPDQLLVIYHPMPDSPTAARLGELAAVVSNPGPAVNGEPTGSDAIGSLVASHS